jgi:bacterioferritin
MKHAEMLIGRILFLEGLPVVSNLKKITIGDVVDVQLGNDHHLEEDAIKSYNAAIILAEDVKDYATQDFLQKILNDEDKHIDDIEELQDQIKQMALPVFLSTQV